MKTKQDTIQLIASPCHLETLNTVVRPLLTNGSNVDGWVLVTTMERKGYWNEVLTTSDRVANEGATKTSKGNGGQVREASYADDEDFDADDEDSDADLVQGDAASTKKQTKRIDTHTKSSTLVDTLPVILLTYETIGALKTLLDTGNIIVILDQAENLLNLTRPHKWFKPSSSCYVRMFTTGIRVEDAMSLTILAAKMRKKEPTTDSSTSDSSTLQTLRHDYLKAVHPPESFMGSIASTRKKMWFLTKVVLAYAIVNGAQRWVPRWVRSLSSTFASFQPSLSRTHRGGGRCTRRTQRHRSSWNDSPMMVVLSRKQRRRVTCRSQRKERKERKERTSGGQMRPQKRQTRHVTQKPSGGVIGMGTAASVMAILWAMSNVNKDWTLINAVPKIVNAILTFLLNLLPGIYKGMEQFADANKQGIRQYTRQVGNHFKRLMGAMQQTAQHTTKSFPAFTRWMRQTFHQFQQVFALDSVMAKVVIVMVGMMVLMWLIEGMWGDGRIGAVTKAVKKVENTEPFKELYTYWDRVRCTEKNPYHNILSVSIESKMDTESMFLCSRFAKQRPIGAGHMTRLKEVRALYDRQMKDNTTQTGTQADTSNKKETDWVAQIITSIKQKHHLTQLEKRMGRDVYWQQPILLVIPDELDIPTGTTQLKKIIQLELDIPKSTKTTTESNSSGTTQLTESKSFIKPVIETVTTEILCITMSEFMKLKFDSHQRHYAVQELHFARPPSPWEFNYIRHKLIQGDSIRTTRYLRLGSDDFGLAMYIGQGERRIHTPVFQYIRKYTNINPFERGQFHRKHIIKQIEHVITTLTFPKTPDELLVDLYREEEQEWDIFQGKIKYGETTRSSDTSDDIYIDIPAIQKTFHTQFEKHLTQVRKTLSDANFKSPSPKELLGHYRAEMQKYERQLKHEARQEELEKEYQALHKTDGLSLKKQIFNSMFSKIQNEIGVIQRLKRRSSRKRGKSRRHSV